MTQSVKQAVLFDLDGTLLDTLADLKNAVNYILNKYGYPEKSMEETKANLGFGAAELIKRSLPNDVDPDKFARCLEEYKAYYSAHSQVETAPYAGVIDVIRNLKSRGVKVAVVSNKPDLAVGALCRDYFDDLIDFSVGDRSDISRKPDAAPVRLAMKRLGCEKAIFVGDSEIDIKTANNAQIPCISVTWGFRDEKCLKEYGAKYFADTSEELEQLCRRLLEEVDE
jgi:phosphoglycolate phosphatase